MAILEDDRQGLSKPEPLKATDLSAPSVPAPAAPVAPSPPVSTSTAGVASPAVSPAAAPVNPKLAGVEPTLAGAIQAMLNLAGGRIWITSGHRDDALQTKLWFQAVKEHGEADAGNWVAKPISQGGNGSNHERGEAVDLGGDMALAHQLATRLGLSFPMSWEPWHVELPSTRANSHPGAYTPSPFGDPNPTEDPSIAAHPDHVMATGIEAIRRMAGSGVGAADTSAVGFPLGPGGTTQTGLTTSTDNSHQVSAVFGNHNNGTTTVGGQPVPTPSYAGTPGQPLAPSPSRDAYINTILPYVAAESKRTGIPMEVMIVQSGLETGWGTSQWWQNQHNPAGIGVTGQAGKGSGYPDLGSAFKDYADKLMGIGEAGQQQFVNDVRAGASPQQLLADLQQSPWAAGHYGGTGLTDTYGQLYGTNRQAPPAPPPPAPTVAARGPAAPQPRPSSVSRGGIRRS